MIPSVLQIFTTLFALFALSRVVLRVRDHQLSVREASFWSLIWIGIVVVVWIPGTALAISRALGLGGREPIDTLVYISIVVLFYLVYRIYVRQEQLAQDITRLVRSVSIHQSRKGKE